MTDSEFLEIWNILTSRWPKFVEVEKEIALKRFRQLPQKAFALAVEDLIASHESNYRPSLAAVLSMVFGRVVGSRHDPPTSHLDTWSALPAAVKKIMLAAEGRQMKWLRGLDGQEYVCRDVRVNPKTLEWFLDVWNPISKQTQLIPAAALTQYEVVTTPEAVETKEKTNAVPSGKA